MLGKVLLKQKETCQTLYDNYLSFCLSYCVGCDNLVLISHDYRGNKDRSVNSNSVNVNSKDSYYANGDRGGVCHG